MIQKIYKFGGASVKDAETVRNLAEIVGQHKDDDILLVVSAMGKTTNMLEKVLADFRTNDGNLGMEALQEVIAYHDGIIQGLFGENADPDFGESIATLFIDLWEKLQKTDQPYDYQYDQTVSYGELISTSIIQEYLNKCDIPTRWIDARKYVISDIEPTFRTANPDWDETRLKISKLNDEHIRGIVCLTQGFIGGTPDGKHSVTLGREGSDFTAAIFANCLDAKEVTIWKDVDGLLNADPKRFADTVQLPHIPYSEAIELAFYGATIIHPKTIKPLQNKGITLKVQSFLHPNHEPSVIDGGHRKNDESIPSYIVKDNQTLVSISPRDYSFMDERNLKTIFAACADLGIHANMIQTSALMLSFCFDSDEQKLKQLRAFLKADFSVKYNEGLTLFTIRHYQDGLESDFIKGKRILVKQGSRSTMQFVLGA
ncbi:MAG: aspartate kinase [Bacteroidales bacterium]|nr:aspartate kinase [Bacteroidales bacterium]